MAHNFRRCTSDKAGSRDELEEAMIDLGPDVRGSDEQWKTRSTAGNLC